MTTIAPTMRTTMVTVAALAFVAPLSPASFTENGSANPAVLRAMESRTSSWESRFPFSSQIGGAWGPSGGTSTPVVQSIATRIQAVRDQLGLTTDQMARLFDVSRRSVHNWLSGKRMVPSHEQILENLEAEIREMPAETPLERRAILLEPRDGETRYQQLCRAARTEDQLQFVATTPDELL